MKNTQIIFALILLLVPSVGFCQNQEIWLTKLWGVKSNTAENIATKIAELPEEFNIPVSSLDFSLDGKYLAVRSANRKINIWDWQKKHIANTLEIVKGANDGLTTEKLKFSPDGKWLVACHDKGDGSVVARVWRTDTWAIAHDIIDPNPGTGCNAVAFTPDGKSLIRILDRIVDKNLDTFVVYSTETWLPIWGMSTNIYNIFTLAISPDGRFAATGGEVSNPNWPYKTPAPQFGNPPMPDTRLIAIIDLVSKTIIRTFQSNAIMDRRSKLRWSPDGKTIVNAGNVGLQVFDAQSGQVLVNIEPSIDGVNASLQFNPNGKYLIEGVGRSRRNGWGKIWDGQHSKLLQDIPENVTSIAISKDGQYLATGSNQKTIIWKLQ